MSQTKVEFVARIDAGRRPGGDLSQMRNYISALNARGVDAREVDFGTFKSDHQSQVAHVFNVERPYDLLQATVGRAERVVISALHQDRRDLKRAWREGRRWGLLAALASVLPWSLRAFASFCLRALRDLPLIEASGMCGRALVHLPGLRGRLGDVLNRAGAVHILSNAEAESLERAFAWDGRNRLLAPNGAAFGNDSSEPLVSWSERSTRILVVGRVEPLKGQLAIAEIAANADVDVEFIGEGNGNWGRYVRRFKQVVDGADNLTWSGRLPNSEVARRMREARVVLNASRVEVQSLADIEAALSGCWVVCGPTGSSREWLKDAVVVESGGDASLFCVARALAIGGVAPPSTTYSWTWDRVVGELIPVYERIARAVNGDVPSHAGKHE